MKKTGLCFSGGGARGAYQIGAAQALKELGILQQISVYSGTSIGAANISILASRSVDIAKGIWFDIPQNPLVKPKSFLRKLREEKLKAFESGLYKMDAFEKKVISEIDFNMLKTKDIFITVSEIGDDAKGIVELFKSAVSQYVKKDTSDLYIPLKELPKEEAAKIITASCSIPVLFPVIKQKSKKYCDGGIFDNTPVKPLIEAGCTEIIIIALTSYNLTHFIKKQHPEVVFHEIRHKKGLGKVLDFSNEHSKEIYDMGYKDTITHFENKQVSLVSNARTEEIND